MNLTHQQICTQTNVLASSALKCLGKARDRLLLLVTHRKDGEMVLGTERMKGELEAIGKLLKMIAPVLAASFILHFSSFAQLPPLPPDVKPVLKSPKAKTVLRSARMVRAAFVILPPLADHLRWDASPDISVTSYKIEWSNTSSATFTNSLITSGTTAIVSPPALIYRLRAINDSGAESEYIYGQKAAITRTGVVSFVPVVGVTNVLLSSPNPTGPFTTTERTVIGSTRTNIALGTLGTGKFFTVRAK